MLWPWSGWLAVTIGVSDSDPMFTGEAAGQITLTVSTPSVRERGERERETDRETQRDTERERILLSTERSELYQ